MKDFLEGLSTGAVVRIAIFLAAVIIVLIVFLVLRHKIKRFFAARRADKELLESLKIDTIRTDLLTRDDVHAWFDGYLKNGQKGLLMTSQALSAKNNDIRIPSCMPGSSAYYLAVYSPEKDETVRQRFIVSKALEPELAALLEEHSGSVVFEA